MIITYTFLCLFIIFFTLSWYYQETKNSWIYRSLAILTVFAILYGRLRPRWGIFIPITPALIENIYFFSFIILLLVSIILISSRVFPIRFNNISDIWYSIYYGSFSELNKYLMDNWPRYHRFFCFINTHFPVTLFNMWLFAFLSTLLPHIIINGCFLIDFYYYRVLHYSFLSLYLLIFPLSFSLWTLSVKKINDYNKEYFDFVLRNIGSSWKTFIREDFDLPRISYYSPLLYPWGYRSGWHFIATVNLILRYQYPFLDFYKHYNYFRFILFLLTCFSFLFNLTIWYFFFL